MEELRTKLDEAENELEENPKLKKAREEIDTLLQEAEERQNKLDAIEKEFDQYKKDYKVSVRQKIIGRKIAQLETTKRIYKDIVIKDVTPVGLRVTYSEGGGRIRFDELSEKLQMQLGYDEEEAAAHLADEAERRAAVASKMAEAREDRISNQKETAKLMAKSDVATARRDIAKLKAWVNSAHIRIRQLEGEAYSYDKKHRLARLRGRSSSWSVRADGKRKEASAMLNKIANAEQRIAELQSEVDSAGR